MKIIKHAYICLTNDYAICNECREDVKDYHQIKCDDEHEETICSRCWMLDLKSRGYPQTKAYYIPTGVYDKNPTALSRKIDEIKKGAFYNLVYNI